MTLYKSALVAMSVRFDFSLAISRPLKDRQAPDAMPSLTLWLESTGCVSVHWSDDRSVLDHSEVSEK